MNRMMKACQADDCVPVMAAHFWFSLEGKKKYPIIFNIFVFSAVTGSPDSILLLPCDFLRRVRSGSSK